MNYKQLYEARGVKFYYGMDSMDFVKSLANVPMLYEKVPGASDMVDSINAARQARMAAEKALANAKEALDYAERQAVLYHVTLNTHVDKFLKVVQDPGSFLGDGGPLIGPVTPTAVVNQTYGVMKEGNDVDNLNNQIKDVIPQAKATVAAKEAALEAARTNETNTVNECITLLVVYEV